MMKNRTHLSDRVIVIGSGIGGLAAALPLAHLGCDVTVLERHATVGGKMRQVNGVDAGPTVLTMRDVFDDLFESVGETLDDHIQLIPQKVLARHWWPDSGPLDLFPDMDRSAAAIGDFAGTQSKDEFLKFAKRAERLFAGFRDPMMQSAEPQLGKLAAHVLRNPHLILDMAPGQTLKRLLTSCFSDPRLRQLFGRYATYVGGAPDKSPALLSLIWDAEARGVWCVKGGMHALACALANVFVAKGGVVRTNAHVTSIETSSDGVTGVRLADGEQIPADRVIFNGDPRALALGLLGESPKTVAKQTLTKKRSHSANVWSFKARPSDLPLVHHNVFFCNPKKNEFADIAKGQIPSDPTLYICAEDRGQDTLPPSEERFEIIMNTPPLTERAAQPEDYELCHTRTFPPLRNFGLTFSPEPGPESLSTATTFDALFPGSAGSLYGQTPHGMTAALDKPTARTKIPGLYLAGGGTHPGAGVPMAALSGRQGAEAMLTDLTSTSRSQKTGTRGGMSMASATTANALSRSSGS